MARLLLPLMEMPIVQRLATKLAFLSLIAAATACSASSSDETDQSEGAITPAEAAKQASKKTELVLSKEPASERSKRELGIVDWTVYGINDYKSGAYLLVYATDSEGQVKYGIAVDKMSGSGSIAQFDKAGPDKKAPRPSDVTAAILREDLAALSDKLLKQSARTCGQEASAAILKSVVAVLGAAVGLAADVVWLATSWDSVGLLSVVTAPIAAGGSWVTLVTMQDASKKWRETAATCRKP